MIGLIFGLCDIPGPYWTDFEILTKFKVQTIEKCSLKEHDPWKTDIFQNQ